MKRKRYMWTCTAASIAMLVMILDSKSVVRGAAEGIRLCFWTVIPSLFPFFIVSNLITSNIAGRQFRVLRPLGRICGIPHGSESILLLGFIGGYPIGAQAIQQACDAGTLTKKDACRMLGFCNNAGPAFIFGMVSTLFASSAVGWLLWLICIISAILTAWILPEKSNGVCKGMCCAPSTLPQALQTAVKSMASVCGWVIAFRVVLTLVEARLLMRFLPIVQTVCVGILELSNGVLETAKLDNPALSFLLCSVFLNFGGICVAMQTASAAKGLSLRYYFIGKILQSFFCITLTAVLMPLLFDVPIKIAIFGGIALCAVIIICRTLCKKRVAFFQKIVYNRST